ncbi:ARF/SAR superfamily, partial [Ceratobasidium sp. AG-I]
NTNTIFLVVDSSDQIRIYKAREKLHLLFNELSSTPLLIFINKQDLPDAISAAEIVDNLGLHTVGR